MRFKAEMRNVSTGLFICFAVLCFAGSNLFGGPVLYHFTGTTVPGASPSHMQTFQLTAPDFLPAVLDGGPLPLLSTDPAIISCIPCDAPPLPALFFLRGSSGDSIQFEDENGTGYVYFFPANSLSSLGTHNSLPGINVNRGVLLVTATPEASTIWLLLFGMVTILSQSWLRGSKIQHDKN